MVLATVLKDAMITLVGNKIFRMSNLNAAIKLVAKAADRVGMKAVVCFQCQMI